MKVFRKIIVASLTLSLVFAISFSSFAVSLEEMDLSSGDPYYKLWNNKFITYIDNYKGDIKDVSPNDLKSGNGTSRIYFFTKLGSDKYTYDTLLADIKNDDASKNLHDAKPILINLPKTAKSFESHNKFANDDEKGKLFSGGPYSKYSTYENGFYYEDKLIDKEKVNSLLKEYADKVAVIDKRLKNLKKYSIKDIYATAKTAYLTNGGASEAGTADSIIYVLNLDTKFSPYDVSVVEMKKSSTNTLKGSSTLNVLPDWDVCTLYIYSDDGKTLLEKVAFADFKQKLWDKQK